MTLVSFFVRTTLTLCLLVQVYEGSRAALVIVLALICLANEIAAHYVMLLWKKQK